MRQYSSYSHFLDEDIETQRVKELPDASQLVRGNVSTQTQVSCALSTGLHFSGRVEGGSPILLVAPKSPGSKDFMVMVGARAGVIGQD